MQTITQIGWPECNNRMPMCLICKLDRTKLGIVTAHECEQGQPPFESIVKISTVRGGITSSQLALTELQFRELIGTDKVTVNEKVADALDLEIGSEVVLTKPSRDEIEAFFDRLMQGQA